MTPDEYQRFTDTLHRTLAADPRVLGLIAAGSMAATDHLPDQWSDHDFWIVTEPGAQEHFRTVYNWLPDHAQIVLVFRETEHGLKVLYASGHLVEYAVFDPDELGITKINSYRVLLNRERLVERLAAIHENTAQGSTEQRRDDAFLFGQFLTNLWVGVGRYARGEKLSGHHFVKVQALGHLLPLLAKFGATDHGDLLDNLDPYRRFEAAFPEIGAAINAALLLETPQTALQWLALAERLLRDHLPDYPAEAVAVIRRHSEAVSQLQQE